jgi:hypothetical protein
MTRIFSFIVSLALAFPLSLSTARASAPSTGSVQVVYLQDGTTLTTYNVDPQSLNATPVGQTLNLPLTTFGGLTASLSGAFLYIQGTDSSQKEHLWVFSTDASGVPQSPPVQELKASGLYNFELAPGGNFAYALVGTANSQNQTIYSILRYTVDPGTGLLSAPTFVARYPPQGPCASGVLGSSPGLGGFSPNGQKFYDDWFCVYPGSTNATYYERSIYPQTGSLSPEVRVYNWNNGSAGYDNVTFLNNEIFDFSIPNPNTQGTNSLSIYPAVPYSTTPLVKCTASMLQACGNSIGASVHPSGRYVFFVINYYTDEIAKLDIPSGRLLDTSHYIPDQVAKFSPDGSIVYALSVGSITYDVEIFGFDPATADVTTGGSIHAPAISDTFWPVLRH